MIKVWRANLDIKIVTSKNALIAYLAKYISKCEIRSKGMDELYSTLLNTMSAHDQSKWFIHKFLIRLCGERDISAQEVCHILMGKKLYSSGGRQFVLVKLSTTDQWSKVQAGTNIFKKCLHIY